MAKNSDLSAAKTAKNDEFYTQLPDIEKELAHYKEHFKGKTVFCNCDDPFESNFFKYFFMMFNILGLKKLISISYAGSAIAGKEFIAADGKSMNGPYKAVVTSVRDANGDGKIDFADAIELFKTGENQLIQLKGDGDFRSPESIEALKEADIVVTNPPFSLFRPFLSLLVEHGKNFLIIGNLNAITYKEVFPLIRDNKLWLGASIHSGDRAFYVPDSYPLDAAGCGVDENGRKFIRVKGVRWFTNLDIKKRHEKLILYKKYNPEDYPKYDNYDVISVDKVKDIPEDYDGVMGVPITIMDKYNSDQFEIIGMAEDNGRGFSGIAAKWDGKSPHCIVDGHIKYKRIFIRRKQG